MEAQPSLRNGSYGNSVEEWAEARLFEYWLLWATSSDDEKKTRTPFLLHSEICKEMQDVSNLNFEKVQIEPY